MNAFSIMNRPSPPHPQPHQQLQQQQAIPQALSLPRQLAPAVVPREGVAQQTHGATSMDVMLQQPEVLPTKKRAVCQGFSKRSSNRAANIITLLEAMVKHPPFVKRGKSEAWQKVAVHVQKHGGTDMKSVSYNLCMKTYEELKKEFQNQEAVSRSASGVTEELSQKDIILATLTKQEADFNDFNAQGLEEDQQAAETLEEFEGNMIQQDSLRRMITADAPSSSAILESPLPSSSSTSATTSSATADTVRFNPTSRRKQRSSQPQITAVEKSIIETMSAIRDLVQDMRDKLS